jgi:hypothetical protein
MSLFAASLAEALRRLEAAVQFRVAQMERTKSAYRRAVEKDIQGSPKEELAASVERGTSIQPTAVDESITPSIAVPHADRAQPSSSQLRRNDQETVGGLPLAGKIVRVFTRLRLLVTRLLSRRHD